MMQKNIRRNNNLNSQAKEFKEASVLPSQEFQRRLSFALGHFASAVFLRVDVKLQ